MLVAECILNQIRSWGKGVNIRYRGHVSKKPAISVFTGTTALNGQILTTFLTPHSLHRDHLHLFLGKIPSHLNISITKNE